VAEREERLDGGEGAIVAGGLEVAALRPEIGGIGLDIDEGKVSEGLGHEREESAGLGGISSAGMGTGLKGQPEVD
jgi:hypothetical protein